MSKGKNLSALEAKAKYVGKKGVLGAGMLRIAIMVLDVKQAYGRIDLLISPVAGEGEDWVRATSVTIEKP